MDYTYFLKYYAMPLTHWKFNKPRQNNGSSIVLIADIETYSDSAKNRIVMMDVCEYGIGAERIFKRVFATDFFLLFESKILEPFTPKA